MCVCPSTCLCDHDISVTGKESCRGWTCIKMFTIYKGTPWCVQPGSKKGPQRSWLKAKLNPAPPLPRRCYNSKSQCHQDTSLLFKPLAVTEHCGKIEGLGSNLVLLPVQQVLLASCCCAQGFPLQTMKEWIRFELNLSLGLSFVGKAWESWQQLKQLIHGHQRLLPWVYNGNPCDPHP